MKAHAPILLTGASGFIGRHLTRRLTELTTGPEILTIDMRSTGGSAALVSHAIAANGTLHELSSLRECTLVHLAWCPPSRAQVAPHARQVELLAGLLDSHGRSMGRIIALGSAEEYGIRSGRLQEEDAMNHSLSPYGWGKRTAQMLVETWCDSNAKPGFWLRPFLVYGEGQQSDMALSYAVRQAMHREIAEFSAGTQQRDFIHVDDVARAIALAVDLIWSGFHVANLGTGSGTRLRDVLERISRIFDASELFRYGVRPMRPGEPESQIAATEQAAKLLGFTAQITLDDGLHRMKKHLENTHNVDRP